MWSTCARLITLSIAVGHERVLHWLFSMLRLERQVFFRWDNLSVIWVYFRYNNLLFLIILVFMTFFVGYMSLCYCTVLDIRAFPVHLWNAGYFYHCWVRTSQDERAGMHIREVLWSIGRELMRWLCTMSSGHPTQAIECIKSLITLFFLLFICNKRP